MKINTKGLQLIKDFEGLRLDSYICEGNTLSVGFGHTKTVSEDMSITQKKADELLLEDIKYFEEKVSELVIVPLTSNQFSALVSFTFTVGENAFADSTLLSLLNSGDYEGASTQFLRWDKVDGLPSRRRTAEMELFLLSEEVQPTSLQTYKERFEAVMGTHHDLVKELITEIEKLENS